MNKRSDNQTLLLIATGAATALCITAIYMTPVSPLAALAVCVFGLLDYGYHVVNAEKKTRHVVDSPEAPPGAAANDEKSETIQWR